LHDGIDPLKREEHAIDKNPARGKSTDNPLCPLLRLRQISEELRGAAQRNDLEVVRAAAKLLRPTVDRCIDLRDRLSDGAGEAAQVALQIHTLLAECETILTQSMLGVAAEMKRIRQGKRTLASRRSRSTSAAPGRTLG